MMNGSVLSFLLQTIDIIDYVFGLYKRWPASTKDTIIKNKTWVGTTDAFFNFIDNLSAKTYLTGQLMSI